MDRKCKNCKFFKKGSVEPAKRVWGDCLKLREHVWGARDRQKRVLFKWADESCDDFQPQETPANQPIEDPP